MRELLVQMGHLHARRGDAARRSGERNPRHRSSGERPRSRTACRSQHLGQPLAGSLLPWIDRDLGNGYSREEFKAGAEGNKILGLSSAPVPIDGICVRIGAMRCHSQAVTIKLKRAMKLAEVERAIAGAHEWMRIVPNEREASLAAAHARRSHRQARHRGRAHPPSRDGRGLRHRLHGRRPAAVGSGGAAPAHAATARSDADRRRMTFLERRGAPLGRLLAYPNFTRFLSARLLASIAVQMQTVAVGWQIYAITRDPLDLGLIGLSQFLPFVLLVLPAGHVADRRNRAAILSLCIALEFLCALAAARVHALRARGRLAGVRASWSCSASRARSRCRRGRRSCRTSCRLRCSRARSRSTRAPGRSRPSPVPRSAASSTSLGPDIVYGDGRRTARRPHSC